MIRGMMVLHIRTTNPAAQITVSCSFWRVGRSTIYTPTTALLSRLTRRGIPYLRVAVAPQYNLSFSWQVARRILKDPVLYTGDRSGNNTYTFQYYDRKDRNRTLTIYRNRFLVLYKLKGYNTTTPRDIKDFLPNGTLINISLKFVKFYRGNNTDYRVESIVYSRMWKGNTTTGKRVLLGYLKQSVTLRQYINGIPVKGFYGRVTLTFGPGGVLVKCVDLSLPYTKVVRRGTTRPITSVLNDIAENGYAGLKERNLTLKSWYPIFMTHGNSREVVFLGY